MLDLFRASARSAPRATPIDPDFQLKPDQIIETAGALRERIEDRFPGRGIGRLAERLETIAKGTTEQLAWVARPLFGIRLFIVALIAAAVGLVARIVIGWQLPSGIANLVDLAEVMDAFMNELIVVGAGLFFVMSFEGRVKRRRALQALRQLRALAHIIDMHQLTKDPARIHHPHPSRRAFSQEDLSVYLDFCSEMLAIVAKMAALYAQHLDDAVVLAAVDEVESLTSGLSAKILQKIVILESSLAI